MPNNDLQQELIARQVEDPMLALRKASSIGAAPEPVVMEAGLPTGKGVIFEMMKRAGKFAGERTTGGFSPTNLVTDEVEGLYKWGPKLSERIPEFAPKGGESVVNMFRKGVETVVDPVERAYLRILSRGGK